MKYWFIIIITGLCSACNNSNTQVSDVSNSSTLMAIFAHPDDESTVAPILAKYVREGVDVHLVIATDGRYGVNDFSGLEAGDGLVEIRRGEMQCSADQLGVQLHHLDYNDQLRAAEGYDGHIPHVRSLVLEIHELISDVQPDALITFGPDGVSTHLDHRLVGASVTQAYLSTKWEREMKLFYYGIPEGQIENPDGKVLRGQVKNYLNTVISYNEDDLEAAYQAFSCHKSQFPPSSVETMKDRKSRNGMKVYLREFVAPTQFKESLF